MTYVVQYLQNTKTIKNIMAMTLVTIALADVTR